MGGEGELGGGCAGGEEGVGEKLGPGGAVEGVLLKEAGEKVVEGGGGGSCGGGLVEGVGVGIVVVGPDVEEGGGDESGIVVDDLMHEVG